MKKKITKLKEMGLQHQLDHRMHLVEAYGVQQNVSDIAFFVLSIVFYLEANEDYMKAVFLFTLIILLLTFLLSIKVFSREIEICDTRNVDLLEDEQDNNPMFRSKDDGFNDWTEFLYIINFLSKVFFFFGVGMIFMEMIKNVL